MYTTDANKIEAICYDQMLKLLGTIVLLLVIVNFVLWPASKENLIAVNGPDGRAYTVRPSVDPEKSAAALARINARISILIHRLRLECEPTRREMVERMATRYNTEALSEGVIAAGVSSYTVNKGEQLVYCLRTRDKRDLLYSDNKLMHVAIHELAHIASVTTGHEHEFKMNLHYLERKAAEMKLIQPIMGEWEYCGVRV